MVACGFKSSGKLSIYTFRIKMQLDYNKSLQKAVFSVLIVQVLLLKPLKPAKEAIKRSLAYLDATAHPGKPNLS